MMVHDSEFVLNIVLIVMAVAIIVFMISFATELPKQKQCTISSITYNRGNNGFFSGSPDYTIITCTDGYVTPIRGLYAYTINDTILVKI